MGLRLAIVLSLGVGCSWPGGGDHITDVHQHVGELCDHEDEHTGSAQSEIGISAFECRGGTSEIECSWAGGIADLCARAHGIHPDECRFSVGSPYQINPGPSGNGGGDWELTLERAGVVLAGPVTVSVQQ